MTASRDKVIMFGDSITERSCAQHYSFAVTPAMQNLYWRKLDFIVRGFGGYNTNHGKHIIDRILDAEQCSVSKIRLVVVFLGTNDCVPETNSKQHVPLQDYIKNLHIIVEKIQSRSIPCILVGTALYDEQAHPSGDRSTLDFLRYNQAAKSVAEHQKIGFVDLWTAFAKKAGWEEGDKVYPGVRNSSDSKSITFLLEDGVHFAGPGYRVWYDELKKVIHEKHADLRPENIEILFPRWDDIDENDVEGSFR